MPWPWLNQVHPGPEVGVDGCSQPGSGKPGAATTLAHTPPPANGQTATEATPAHQSGSQEQGAGALQQTHSLSVHSKLFEEEKQGSTDQRSLISLELLRLGHVPSVRKEQWHAGRGRMRSKAVPPC